MNPDDQKRFEVIKPYIQAAAHALSDQSPYSELKVILSEALRTQAEDKAETLCLQFLLTVAKYLAYFRKSWESHPQYQSLTAEYPWVEKKSFIPVLISFSHEEGIGGSKFSFGITDFQDFGSVFWLRKNKGMSFHRIHSLPFHMKIDPIRPSLITRTMDGRARAYLSRMELKRLLPRKFHKLISRYRGQWSRFHKYSALGTPIPQLNWLGTDEIYQAYLQSKAEKRSFPLPAWYQSYSRLEVFSLIFENHHPLDCKQMNYYLGSTLNFVNACTGHIHPNDVEALFIRLPAARNRHKTAQSLNLKLPLD